MKNKLNFLVMLVCVLAFGLAFTACGGKSAEGSGGKAGSKAAQKLAGSLNEAMAGNADSFIELLASASSDALAALPTPPSKDFSYELNKAGDGVNIMGYTGTNPVLIIPATIEGYPVVGIYMLGKSRTKVPLISVVIPENVKVIGQRAFMEQNNLKSVVLPGSITEIGGHAFIDCSELNTLILPESVTSITFLIEGGV